MLAPLLLEHDYICSATMFDDGRGHLDSLDRRSAHAGFLIVGCSQHFELYRGAHFLLQGRNAHGGAQFDAKLFSTCSNDCERHNLSAPVSEPNSPPKSRVLYIYADAPVNAAEAPGVSVSGLRFEPFSATRS